MASQLKVDTITGVTTAGSIAVTGEGNSTTTNLQQGLCKCWINFDGSAGSIAAADSFNSSGLTDTATGKQTISMSNAMSNDDYSAMATCNNNTLICSRVSSKATGSYASTMTTPGNTDTDVRNSTTVHGDLA